MSPPHTLALTCRALYGICFAKHKVLDVVDREELPLILEKDVTTLYFCHSCVKLHRWHGRWSRSITPSYAERMPFQAISGTDGTKRTVSQARLLVDELEFLC
jgi:hypothetical protein